MLINKLPLGMLFACSRHGFVFETIRLISRGKYSSIYIISLERNFYALKWFHSAGNILYRNFLEDILYRIVGIASPNQSFLWPFAVCVDLKDLRNVSSLIYDGIGYLMPLKQRSHVDSIKFVKGVKQISLKSLLNACSSISYSLACLHDKGMFHRDLSLNNILVDSVFGSVQICDNEFVGIERLSKTSNLESQIYQSLRGTPGFIAPELFNNSYHCANTDNYSLAAVIYCLLSKCIIDENDVCRYLYKIDSLAISNSKKLLIKDLFVCAFSINNDSMLRPSAHDWYSALSDEKKIPYS